MATITTTAAAELMGVSSREVQRLARAGELVVAERIGRSFLLDAASVHRASRNHARSGRPWDEATAWAAIDLLRGGQASWLGVTQRSRLKARLAALSAVDLGWLARRRAKMHILRTSTSYLADVQQALVRSGTADTRRPDADFGLAASNDRVDGYTDKIGLTEIIAAYGLVDDPDGNVIIRESGFIEGPVEGGSGALTALDLSDSLDVRERSAGLQVLDELLTRLRAR